MAKKTRLIHRGRIFDVRREERRLPGGRVVELDIIRHPGAVLIIPFLSADKIILLRQFRPAIDQYLYELPAGTIDRGESPEACAHREIIEETGFCAKSLKLLGFIYPVPGYSTEKIFIYKATGLKPAAAEADPDEVIEPQVVTRARMRRMLKKGKIVDAKTISALALCGLW